MAFDATRWYRPESRYIHRPGDFESFVRAEGAKEADLLSTMDMYYAGQKESARQFDLGLGFKENELEFRYDELEAKEDMFGKELGEKGRQFDLGLEEQQREYDLGLGWEKDQYWENQRVGQWMYHKSRSKGFLDKLNDFTGTMGGILGMGADVIGLGGLFKDTFGGFGGSNKSSNPAGWMDYFNWSPNR